MISHKYKFIFTHIPKNAGTSIENALKDYVEFNEWDCLYKNKSIGHILGSQDIPYAYGKTANTKYIKKLLKETYKDYYKFCVVRNPWDRMVSIFWYRIGKYFPSTYSFEKFITNIVSDGLVSINEDGTYKNWIYDDTAGREDRRKAVYWNVDKIMNLLDNNSTHDSIHKNIQRDHVIHDSIMHNILKPQSAWIDDMDYIIKFEDLQNGFDHVCDSIGIPKQKLGHDNPRILKWINLGYNPDGSAKMYHTEPYKMQYKTSDSIRLVGELYKEDCERFNYDW